MIKKRYIIGIVLVLLIFCATVSAIDAVSAAKYKKIDSNKYTADNGAIVKYTTSFNGKTVKMVNKVYTKNSKYLGSQTYYLTKTSKTQLKIKVVTRVKGSPPKVESGFGKTKLSAKSYYLKKVKPKG
ncbi:MAG: hypothetical protein FWE58_04650 [Methanobrevibacter sp.]|nr:hypothetical protein [Methanobrevibacter sp.]